MFCVVLINHEIKNLIWQEQKSLIQPCHKNDWICVHKIHIKAAKSRNFLPLSQRNSSPRNKTAILSCNVYKQFLHTERISTGGHSLGVDIHHMTAVLAYRRLGGRGGGVAARSGPGVRAIRHGSTRTVSTVRERKTEREREKCHFSSHLKRDLPLYMPLSPSPDRM